MKNSKLQERAIVRTLLEFGLKDWDEETSVANHIFNEMDENDLESMVENKNLLTIINLYKTWYKEGKDPTDKDFLYYEDATLNNLVINLMDSQTEISSNWNKRYEGKIATREDLFREEVISTLTHFKLRKIKKLIEQNNEEMKTVSTDEAMILIKVQQALKKVEKQLTASMGTVYYK
jgi:DNA primase